MIVQPMGMKGLAGGINTEWDGKRRPTPAS
jgi:hypothetical protein